MALKLVVFDMDGTLVDSAALILEGFSHAFTTVGRTPVPAEMARAHIGLSLPIAMHRLMPDADQETLDRAIAGYRDYYFKLRAERGPASVPLFAGARETLDALAARPDVLIGAATGMARRGLDHVLDAHALAPMFATRQSADGHPSKPNPSMLETALAETGVAPGLAVMVGDTTFDIEMAANAGIAGVGVSWGHHSRRALEQAGAQQVVGSFDELLKALDEIWEAA